VAGTRPSVSRSATVAARKRWQWKAMVQGAAFRTGGHQGVESFCLRRRLVLSKKISGGSLFARISIHPNFSVPCALPFEMC
jgi:hypothetical protein